MASPAERSPSSDWAPVIGAIAIDYSGGDQEFDRKVRGLLISTAGTLKVQMADGTEPTLTLAVGIYPFVVRKIFQVGSATAAGHALY